MDDRLLFAVVLAAGQSSRFASTKQLLPFEGSTLVGRAIRTAESICGPRSLLVAGNDWRKVTSASRPLQGFIIINSQFRDGLSSSIRAGVQAIAGVADAVMLLLADQPLVTQDHLRTLQAAWEQSPSSIVTSTWSDTSGPPVIFPRQFFDDLCTLDGDRGAKSVIEKHSDHTIGIEFDDAGVDIDRPEDLEKLHP